MLTRRQLLRGDFLAKAYSLAPPWAVRHFTSACSRCDACVTACPTGLLIRGDGGFPRTDYSRSECTFCGDCATACKDDALRRGDGQAPWSRRILIDDSCLTRIGVVCRSCGEHCDAQAIRFVAQAGGVANPSLDAAACTGCGACVAVCPNRAIRVVANTAEFSRRAA
ncbi:MAG TPA: ferredoxin-type protein NapF [Rhodocyclaceae bacterium]